MEVSQGINNIQQHTEVGEGDRCHANSEGCMEYYRLSIALQGMGALPESSTLELIGRWYEFLEGHQY